MSGAGELVPTPGSGDEVSTPPTGGGGRVYADFMGRLRDYVAPPPPSELGWQAVGGVGMTLGAAGLLELLPSGHAIANLGLLKWLGREGLASTVEAAGGLVEPLALFGLIVLLGVGAVYLTKWGATPALAFLTAQTWLGVAALTVSVLAWIYLLFVLVINLVIWALYILAMVTLTIIVLAGALALLGALASEG